MTKKEKPHKAAQENTRPNLTKPTSKIKRVLQAFASGRSLNRWEAATSLRDWVLPSTVSEIQRHGITVSRVTETVPGYGGTPTRCCRYWLAPEERDKARKLLERL